MTASGDDDIAQRLARLERTDQRVAQALEQLARREVPPQRGRAWDAYAAVICYCSVLDECWVADSSNPPGDVPVEGCPIPVGERFTD